MMTSLYTPSAHPAPANMKHLAHPAVFPKLPPRQQRTRLTNAPISTWRDNRSSKKVVFEGFLALITNNSDIQSSRGDAYVEKAKQKLARLDLDRGVEEIHLWPSIHHERERESARVFRFAGAKRRLIGPGGCRPEYLLRPWRRMLPPPPPPSLPRDVLYDYAARSCFLTSAVVAASSAASPFELYTRTHARKYTEGPPRNTIISTDARGDFVIGSGDRH
ncbi:hypothetical protein LSAT2_017997 [Lamellibrachia satsuma]|nr:hypothetical protein LSAT2_017997 [Lamellibrachia satsuma]